MRETLKRFGVCCLSLIMMIATAIPASATEINDEDKKMVAEFTIDTTEDSGITTYINPTVGGTVSPGTQATFYPTLESYVGLTKKFYAASSSDSTTGVLYLSLYKGDKLVSNNWMMGPTDYTYWTVTLPSSGQYTLKVFAEATNAPTTVYVWWEN